MNHVRRNASAASPGASPSTPPSDQVDAASRLLTDADEAADAPETVEALDALLERIEDGGTAFQAVAVAAVQILERALVFERDASDAALSLGQQEKMQKMVETASSAVDALRDALRAQGAKAIRLCPECPDTSPSSDQPWWFALNEALGVLEEGSSRMSSLTAAQPAGSPARALSECIAQLLRTHHDALLLEADEWIS